MLGLWKMLPGELLLAGGRVPRTLKREHREGPSLGIGGPPRTGGPPVSNPFYLGALPS